MPSADIRPGWWRSATTGPGSPSRPGRSCSPRC